MKKTTTTIVCDRCGAECKPGSWWSVTVRHCDKIDIHKADLCQKCGDDVIVASVPPDPIVKKPQSLYCLSHLRSTCAICGEVVAVGYHWWTKNPETHADARPIHDGRCTSKWMDV
jgi:hypothetical protein